ncbi:MAG: dockerin type I repeat-containing protein [Ruminococcus sp.]|nr:dockerin type I repeat-containing protein [Ruminococcus sp.]
MKLLKTISLILALILVLGCVTVSAEGYTVPDPLLYGDVDMDGEVTIKDATAIQKGIAEIEYLTSVQRFLADPDKTGLSIKNATEIQKYLAGLIESSHIDEAIEMQYTDKFSSEIRFEGQFYENRIYVEAKNINDEYTLEDFPEYDFNRIEMHYFDYDKFPDVKVYELYFASSGEESLKEVIKVLDYRANIDLQRIELVGYDIPI